MYKRWIRSGFILFLVALITYFTLSISGIGINTIEGIEAVPNKFLEDTSQQITSTDTQVTYYLEDLKVDSNFKYPLEPLLFGYIGYGYHTTLTTSQTNLQILHEAYLRKGTSLEMTFTVDETQSNQYCFMIVDESGIVYSFKSDTPTTETTTFKVKKTGNYAILIDVTEAIGSYGVDYLIRQPSIFRFLF